MGRLRGDARVQDGVLTVSVRTLDIQPVGNCEPARPSCVVQSVRLLLGREGDTHFSQLASSEPLPVHADLRELGRWSLPEAAQAHTLHMQLPAAVELTGVRLKLQINWGDGATVYPDHGDTLALHRALAKAHGQSDPCDSISVRMDLVQSGCNSQLQRALQSSPDQKPGAVARAWHGIRTILAKWGMGTAPGPLEVPLDALLLAALESENAEAAQLLLSAGANPNAHSTDAADASSPLGYAAASNQLPQVEALLGAGADARARRTNGEGQVVTPLTQALRTDAAAAIATLLRAGALPRTDDPTGWTPMHIAAYSNASNSLAVLVGAGADINERTPADRQQTVLQTAVQFGSVATVQAVLALGGNPQLPDREGKNACDWAAFFKRSAAIRALVCGTDAAAVQVQQP